jgi:hypothetical protein
MEMEKLTKIPLSEQEDGAHEVEELDLKKIEDAVELAKKSHENDDYSDFLDIKAVRAEWLPHTKTIREKGPFVHLTKVDLGERVVLKAEMPPDPSPQEFGWGTDTFEDDFQYGDSTSSIKSVSFSPAIEEALFGVSKYVSKKTGTLYVYTIDQKVGKRVIPYKATFSRDYYLTHELRVDDDVPAVKIGKVEIEYDGGGESS